MSRTNLLVWIPALIGIILLGVSQIDLYLFKQGVFGVRTILGWELALVIAGLISSLTVLVFGIIYLFKKAWLLALQSFVSLFVFLVLFGIGGVLGGAYINAT